MRSPVFRRRAGDQQPRDPEAVADRARTLLRDEALRRRFGRQGIARVRALFTRDHVARALESVYAGLVRPAKAFAPTASAARPGVMPGGRG